MHTFSLISELFPSSCEPPNDIGMLPFSSPFPAQAPPHIFNSELPFKTASLLKLMFSYKIKNLSHLGNIDSIAFIQDQEREVKVSLLT